MIDNTTTLRGAFEGFRAGGLQGAREEVRNIAGRVMDSENLLNQGNMSPGLRDWDLWGPLLFALMLSLLLSFNARPEQKSVVFSGVFAMVWIGEAVVTAQIKLLGGNMSVLTSVPFTTSVRAVANALFIAPSHSPSALSATPSSPSSSRLCFPQSVSP